MKIVVTAQGPDLSSPVDPRFGRAQHFVVWDTVSKTHAAMSNDQNRQAMQGAGVQAAETVCRSGAEVVLTGHCGPNAFQALSAGGCRVYTGVTGTVAEAIDGFHAERWTPADTADVPGHAGL